MKAKALIAAAALLIGAQAAHAGWTFTEVVVQDPALPGFDVHQYYAKLDPSGAEAGATGLQSVDATLTSNNDMKFKFIDTNQDGIPDAAINGNGITDTVARAATSANLGTFIRSGDPTGGPFFPATVDPAVYQSVDIDGDGVADPGGDPAVAYAHVKSFRVAGIAQGGKDPKAVTDAKGSLFGLAVVPTGSTVTFTGSLAADSGPITNFAFPVPEPTSLAVLGLGGLAVLGRRRRKA